MSGETAERVIREGPICSDPKTEPSDTTAHGQATITSNTVVSAGSESVGDSDKDAAAPADATLASKDEKPNHGFRFWVIVGALAFTALISSLEGTIITSALLIITQDLGGGNGFIWVLNGYFLATIVMLPLMAQASNLFGRRWLMLKLVTVFILGSGICGRATSQAMLIGGRVV